MSLTSNLREYTKSAGIDLTGVTSAREFLVGDEQRAADPCDYLPDARSIVVTACYMYLGPKETPPAVPGTPRGRVGSYSGAYLTARHYSEELVSRYLKEAGYAAVISNKIPFKMAAVRAGIAYYGKNCLVHAEGFGSYLELGCVITNAPLDAAEESVKRSDCGDCTACLSGCPTGAIDSPYHVVRDQCMGRWLGNGLPVPREFREKVGDLIWRCSLCHEVCPLNRGLTPREQVPFQGLAFDDNPELILLLAGDAEYYRKILPGFDVYTGLETLHRNVSIALGNSGDPAAIPALTRALESPDSEVREAAAWALEKLRDWGRAKLP